MRSLLQKISHIFPLSFNVAINIAARIITVILLSGISLEVFSATAYIMTIMGILTFPYYFFIATSLLIKNDITSSNEDTMCSIYSSLLISLTIGIVTFLFCFYGIGPILLLLHQPSNIAPYTLRFFKCYAFAMVTIPLFYCLQNICIGFGKSYIPVYVNLIVSIITLTLLYGLIYGKFGLPVIVIDAAYAFILYGCLGSITLLFYLVFKRKMQIPLVHLQSIMQKLLLLVKIGVPICIHNIHGTFIQFAHVLIIGIACSSLLPIQQIFVQYNLLIFILVLGSTQAITLDTAQYVKQKSVAKLIKNIRGYVFIVFSSILFISIIYYLYIKLNIISSPVFEQKTHVINISFFVISGSYFIYALRNIVIAILINVGDTTKPVLISTFLSVCIGLPLSYFFSYTMKYDLVGIGLGVCIHLAGALVILSKRLLNILSTAINNTDSIANL